jgi:hypothetical protein
MNREVINAQELPAVNSTYSQAVKANGMIFVAGQIGLDPATGKVISSDITEQARRVVPRACGVHYALLDRVRSTRKGEHRVRRILSASGTGEACLRRERALRRRQIRDPGHCRISDPGPRRLGGRPADGEALRRRRYARGSPEGRPAARRGRHGRRGDVALDPERSRAPSAAASVIVSLLARR